MRKAAGTKKYICRHHHPVAHPWQGTTDYYYYYLLPWYFIPRVLKLAEAKNVCPEWLQKIGAGTIETDW